MSRYVSDSLANEVFARANGRCEYCLIAIEDTYFGGEIDHIISIKHGGKSKIENLALSCQPCNRGKGTDLGSIVAEDGRLARFFNPRTDDWGEHFHVSGTGEIEALSDEGQATAKILGFNNPERLLERQGLIELGRYVV